MASVIESAWQSHPGYRIDLLPHPGVVRAWHGDLLLAESCKALRVLETDHAERLYFPEADVKLRLFEENEHHSICPFKGQADYWTLAASEPPLKMSFGPIVTHFPRLPVLRAISACITRRSGSRLSRADLTVPLPFQRGPA